MIAKDASGNGNDGTYTGAPTSASWVAGLVAGNRAYNISDVSAGDPPPNNDSQVGIPVAGLAFTGDFSIIVWYELASLGSATATLFEADGTIGTFQLQAVIGNPSGGTLAVNTDRAFSLWFSSATIPYDQGPHMLAVSYVFTHTTGGVTFGDLTFYIDGVASGTSTIQSSQVSPDFFTATIALGGNVSSNGIYDEVAVFLSALSGGDMAAIYTAATVDFATYAATVLGLNPESYYHLDDGGRGWVLDAIGMAG